MESNAIYPKPDNFRRAVKFMREAQKAYFKERTQANLRASLYYEKLVDQWLERHPEEPAMVQAALNLPDANLTRVEDAAD